MLRSNKHRQHIYDICQGQHVISRKSGAHWGTKNIWKYFGENSEIFAIHAVHTGGTFMEIFRGKLRNFCNTNACKKVFLTGGFSLQWCVHIISGNSPKFLGLSRTMLLQFKISY